MLRTLAAAWISWRAIRALRRRLRSTVASITRADQQCWPAITPARRSGAPAAPPRQQITHELHFERDLSSHPAPPPRGATLARRPDAPTPTRPLPAPGRGPLTGQPVRAVTGAPHTRAMTRVLQPSRRGWAGWRVAGLALLVYPSSKPVIGRPIIFDDGLAPDRPAIGPTFCPLRCLTTPTPHVALGWSSNSRGSMRTTSRAIKAMMVGWGEQINPRSNSGQQSSEDPDQNNWKQRTEEERDNNRENRSEKQKQQEAGSG